MPINGMSGGIAPQTFAALRDTAIAAADPQGKFAGLDAQSKSLESFASRFQKPAVNQEARQGMGAMADRQIGVGSGADSARAREAGGGLRNFFSNLSSKLHSLINGFTTRINRFFTPSVKESKPALAAAAVSQKTQPAATAGPGPEPARTGPPKGLPNPSRNARIGGLNQKLAQLEARAEGFHAQAVALRKAQQGRF